MNAISLLLSLALLTPEGTPEVQKWLEFADATRNAFDEAVITARASQVVDGKVTAATDFEVYTKGRDRGVIVFRSGGNSGRKVLTDGPRMWLIIPGASRPIPVTPNQRLLGGASMADVASLRFAVDYTASLRPEGEAVGGKICRVLDLKAKSPSAPYPRVVLWWNEAEHLPAKVLFSLPSGKEAKEVTFAKFSRKAGRTVVSEMEIRDLLSKDPRTVTRLEYTDYRPAKLDDALFTPEGARGL
ncbi:MAG TPA: outer membrane lipoprotein-sorting protein [Thermoanaerobaculia bacterium]|nr:outer membrane lipoprotein-sorting protein [Thermoanaerobaculia bacterium]